MSFLELKEVSKHYRQNELIEINALKNITLSIDQAEFIAINGPAGSGKSSLLKIIGGLIYPDQGKIIFDGTVLGNLNKKQLTELRLHNIGFILPDNNLISVLTVLENIEYLLMLQGMSEIDRHSKAIEITEELELATLLNKMPTELTKSQQQQIAVARALAGGQKLILADEPTARLDSKAAGELIDLMRKINKKKQITFIFTTDNQAVSNKANRQIILRDGEIFG